MKGTNWAKLLGLIASVVIVRHDFFIRLATGRVQWSQTSGQKGSPGAEKSGRADQADTPAAAPPSPEARLLKVVMLAGGCGVLAFGVGGFFWFRANEAKQAAALARPAADDGGPDYSRLPAEDCDLVLTRAPDPLPDTPSPRGEVVLIAKRAKVLAVLS